MTDWPLLFQILGLSKMASSRPLCVSRSIYPTDSSIYHLVGTSRCRGKSYPGSLSQVGLWFLQGRRARVDGDGKQYVLNVGTQAGIEVVAVRLSLRTLEPIKGVDPETLWKGPIFKGFMAFISFPLVKHYFLTSGFLTKADILYPTSLFILNVFLVHILVAWDAFDLILKLSREIRGRDQLEADCLSW